jgi:hypothetical protein
MHTIHIRPLGLIVGVLWLLVAGCATHPRGIETYLTDSSIPSSLELNETPFFPQQEYQCGPAALATVLAATGISVSPDELTGKVYLPKRRGSLQLELVAASRRYERLPYRLDANLTSIVSELARGRPVLVLQNLGLENYPIWHYAVVIGIDVSRNEIILRSGDRRRLTMSTGKFMRSWELAHHWALVMLKPGEIPAQPDEARYVSAVAALESAGQTEASARFYRAALSHWPDNTLALFGTANIQYARSDREGAESSYRRLLLLQPAHAAARNNYAHVLAERGCHEAALAEIDAGLASMARNGPLREALLDTRTEILSGNIVVLGTTKRTCPVPVSTPPTSTAAQ